MIRIRTNMIICPLGRSIPMNDQYLQGPEKMKAIPTSRAAYSDRTSWLMCEMSALAYLPFEGENPLNKQIKTITGVIKSACKAKKADEMAARISDLEKQLMKYIDQKTGSVDQCAKENTELLKACLNVAGFELVQTFNQGDTQAFLAKRESDRVAVLSFRGTEANSWVDIKTDLNARFYKGEGGVKVHSGFIGAFRHVKDDIRQAVDNLKGYSLYITGHSLGGALAVIAAKELEMDGLAACYTYGSPRVGGEEFGESIKAPVYRIVNAADGVPRVPPSWSASLVVSIITIFNSKVAEFLRERYSGYKHYGDMRYLTACDNDVRKLKVLENLGTLFRAKRLVTRVASKGFLIPAKDHRINEYRNKLHHYADQRNQTRGI